MGIKIWNENGKYWLIHDEYIKIVNSHVILFCSNDHKSVYQWLTARIYYHYYYIRTEIEQSKRNP